MIYFCCEEHRRNAVAGSAINGIDFLEVLDHDATVPSQRQRRLFVHFVNPLAAVFGVANLRLDGGERVRGINVTATSIDGTDNHILVVDVDQPGDFSVYSLSLVTDATHPQPPAGVDPVLASVDFSFKVECPSDFDCAPALLCPPDETPEIEIDYLAKDYASFRRLMLDRMATLVPDWQERHAADFGVAMVELLAYAGDYLSYQQDAVATEAYLNTARRRVSVRRHARLVDYLMHDGCNARAWVQIVVNADVLPTLAVPVPLPAGTPLATKIEDLPPLLTDPAKLGNARAVFQTMHKVHALYLDHVEMKFYTWSDAQCCLPAGATRATLQKHLPNLVPGDVIVFEEVVGPLTGLKSDADPAHRQAVRLTKVQAFDASANPLTDPLDGTQITQIEWARADALTFPLCVSSETDKKHGSKAVGDVSVARGNIVLVDHGLTEILDKLGPVPEPKLFYPASSAACERGEPDPVPARFRPGLKHGPITQAVAYDANLPASQALVSAPEDALPVIALTSTPGGEDWKVQPDLLNSDEEKPHFVAEVEEDGIACLRFGDGLHGRRPDEGMTFDGTCRIGNGRAGNVGREAIFHILAADPAIVGVRNPLAAAGGVDPESMEDVRRRAPSAFRTQQRAVTEADYASVAQRFGGIQRAAATFRWTGSWHTVFLTLDRLFDDEDDESEAKFLPRVRDFVERFRMAGYDLDVDKPRFVSLEIEMHVCVKPDYFRREVEQALLDVFSNHALANGQRGAFHADNFTFGQSVYLSPLYAAAQSVAGVESAEIRLFRRQGQPDPKPLIDGLIPLSDLEIARLDNDPNFPEHGVFRLSLDGGK